MFCNKCGREIANDSRVCKFCGSTVAQTTINYNINSNTTAKRKNPAIIGVGIAFSAIVDETASNVSTSGNTISDNKKEDKKINLEKFNKIKTGMTYKQVVEIIGEEGTVLSESNISNNEKYHTVMYYWYGKDGISNANITIQGGKVISKAQIGLK